MYAAVPRIIPAEVAAMLMVGESSGLVPSRHHRPHLRQSEIQHLYRAVGLDLDVAGLQVAMNDAFLVGRLQRVRDLARDSQRFVQRNRALP